MRPLGKTDGGSVKTGYDSVKRNISTVSTKFVRPTAGWSEGAYNAYFDAVPEYLAFDLRDRRATPPPLCVSAVPRRHCARSSAELRRGSTGIHTRRSPRSSTAASAFPQKAVAPGRDEGRLLRIRSITLASLHSLSPRNDSRHRSPPTHPWSTGISTEGPPFREPIRLLRDQSGLMICRCPCRKGNEDAPAQRPRSNAGHSQECGLAGIAPLNSRHVYQGYEFTDVSIRTEEGRYRACFAKILLNDLLNRKLSLRGYADCNSARHSQSRLRKQANGRQTSRRQRSIS